MNASAEHNHLFSPLEGEDADHSSHISFMGAPFVPVDSGDLSSNKAPYVFIGAPFDEGNVGKPGCEDGAREFRVASLGIPSYWFEFNVDLKGLVVDAGDVSMPRVNPDVARERIYNAVRKVLAAGKIPIICGGDRSISIPAAKALSDHLGVSKKMGYMHLGAHLDMADNWAGETHLSTNAMARITELRNLDMANCVHIGARNSSNLKDHVDLAKHRGLRFYPMYEALDRGIDDVMDDAVARVWGGTDAQYLSLNLNILDSSAAPGVTATETGGLESRELMRIAKKISDCGHISVIDVTELCPMSDVSESTCRTAVAVVLRIMAGIQKFHGKTLDASLRRPGWKF
jgi:agmatinase